MDKTTIDTYNRAAMHYAEKFAGVGSRVDEINRAFLAWGNPNPRVLELGCGDGRDAVEICARTNNYIGLDASQEMIELARIKVPDGKFVVADMEQFDFEGTVDIVFALAALLHVDKEIFRQIILKIHTILATDGVFCFSLKEGEYKGKEIVTDDYGDRAFYYYQQSDIEQMIDGFEIVSINRVVVGHTNWLEFTLKRK